MAVLDENIEEFVHVRSNGWSDRVVRWERARAEKGGAQWSRRPRKSNKRYYMCSVESNPAKH